MEAVDQALADRGIPPGIVRADVALRPYHDTGGRDRIFILLIWDVSRTGGRVSVGLTWDDDTGWSYALLGSDTGQVLREAPVASLCRVFATPDDVAEGIVHQWRTPERKYGVGASPARTGYAAGRGQRGVLTRCLPVELGHQPKNSVCIHPLFKPHERPVRTELSE